MARKKSSNLPEGVLDLSSRGVPLATIKPSWTTMARVHTLSTSSKMWVEKMMALDCPKDVIRLLISCF
jgi:hypothetical protein